MLDTETKRRIDTARNILVGKVPDPKSQVEQITIALIYKFMDDMDAQSVEMGGKASFFTGEFEKYGWRRVFDPRLGGFDILALYSEAITKINENANVPQLFRDIFKNAYLPYRDPETLKLFLKTIDEFRYDHSERLGDAFEYLLSVLGSQGDAGQFRTPRHIIDFIVDIVDPQKGETILDPASGTAGFLISAYKHIVENNPKMTPDERKRLMTNVVGYDISPDMVRLGLANMYLHGFPTPEIHEYDTLTSEDRWNEYFDVILANPPFMSPKGGIQPHKKFAISAKRSEVLFVDYIAEHLTTKGRAGIIVPEGIIFQSQTAYKALRKMLVEQCLVAVVSLPAGVFNPYSGVKTSILILDRQLAKQSKSVGFFKVENDGFNLGAQRRPIEQNDLPQVFADINEYFDKLRTGQPTDDLEPQTGIIVPKEKLAANADYNLSGERYRQGSATTSVFPFVRVGDVFQKADESVMPATLDGPVTYIGLENITQNTGKLDGAVIAENPAEIKSLKNVFKPGNILYGKLRPNLNKVWLADRPGICSTDIFVIRPTDDRAIGSLYANIFRSGRFNDAVMSELKGAQLPRVGWTSFADIEIPLPPLEVQREIVAEIEGYQKVIDGARAVIDNYRPHIPINPTWPMVGFAEVVFFQEGPGIRNWQFTSSGIKLLNVKNIVGGRVILDNSDKYISVDEFDQKYSHFLVEDGDIILASSGATYGKNAYFRDPGYRVIVNTSNIRLHPLDPARILQGYIKSFLDSPLFKQQVDRLITGAAQPNFGPSHLKQIQIPLPPIEEQERIVAEIEAEQRLVEANRELIERMEAKIADVLDRIWGTDEQADAAATSANV